MSAGVRRALAVLCIVLLLGLIAAHRLLHRDASAAARSGALALRAVGGVLSIGQLTLRPCSIGGRQGDALASVAAWCTLFPVPENWQDPLSRRIQLAVALVPAVTDAPAPDLVTFLDGGPGGAARQDYPDVAAALAPLRERRAILLVDQRGTGGSNALDCPALQGPASQLPASQGAAGEHADTIAQRLTQCLAQLRPRAAAQFYTTTAAVQDLEAVRRALGAPRLDLIGLSYGTRVAQQFAARFPASVRSVVLDSPVPNRLALLSEHARNLEQALRLQFAQCRAVAACKARFQDPYATLQHLRTRLQAAPASVTLPDPVTFEPLHLTLTAADLAAVVRFDAYSSLTAALLPLMLDEAERGNYVPLLGQKTLFTSDLADQITGGEELSVLCAEDVDLLMPRAEDAQTLLGNDAITRAQAACRLWPRGTRPADFHAPFRSELPVLVLDGEFDPVTPPAYGAEILATLPRGRQLIARGQGHAVIGAGCLPRLVQRFVETLDARDLDARCLAELAPTPAFIDYDGAPP
ncbi:MAG TPA: alpha/beta fold hydrolase [Steroidobacteraceae bacterium]|nr:alpha/beta fold hydrolase [Steroidobacteraceae bacterium]